MSAEFGNGPQQNIDQSQQQVSFHFWSCQLTEANPRYHWEPENTNTSAAGKGERPKRQTGRHGDQKGDHADANGGGEKAKEPASNGEKAKEPASNGEKAKEPASNGEKAKEPASNGEKAKEPASNGDEKTENGDKDYHDGQDANGEAATDADFMQHVLKVNACILGPKATGVHLIAVRTRCYRQAELDTCPIVCIDPDSQRTVSLGYEFVLDSQNEVTFKLAEGAGPVWLTGLHQVRVHDPDGDVEGQGDDDEIDYDNIDAESIDEEADVDESMDLNEEDDDEEEDNEEEEEAARPVAKRVARASKTDQQRPVASPKKRKPAAAAAAKRGGGRTAKNT